MVYLIWVLLDNASCGAIGVLGNKGCCSDLTEWWQIQVGWNFTWKPEYTISPCLALITAYFNFEKCTS